MNIHQQKKIAEAIVQVEAFKDLSQPVIYTSGEIGLYYINTEKLLEDQGAWEQYGDDPDLMYEHCCSQAKKSKVFEEVIAILADSVKSIAAAKGLKLEDIIISGGQRRDWLFSAPVAKLLARQHLALFKDGQSILQGADGKSMASAPKDLSGKTCIHIVDLLTKGSSAYDPNQNPPTGWIVEIRKLGAKIDSLITVVSRCQGGEEILASQEVEVLSGVKINSDFLRDYSKFPERACEYLKNPRAWSENYLRENSLQPFVEYFNPNESKFSRAQKFAALYADVLKAHREFSEFKDKVRQSYDYVLEF